MSFSQDGQLLAAGGRMPIPIWDVRTGKTFTMLKGDNRSARRVKFSPDGMTLATAGWDKTVRLCDVFTGNEIKEFKVVGELIVKSIAFSPDGKTLASSSWDQTVRLWDAATGTQLRIFKGHIRGALSVSFSPDGKSLASAGGENGIAYVWDVDSITKRSYTISEE